MKHFIYTLSIHLSLIVSLFTYQAHVINAQYTLQGHWEALGEGLNGHVTDILISGNDVYVTGYFTDAGGHEQADHIARWDGENWHPVGSKIHGTIYTIVEYQDGFIVGGDFTNIGGLSAGDFVARWDGENWQAIGPVVNDVVKAVTVFQDKIYIAGKFKDAGGHADADHLAFFDGTNWQPVDGVDTSSFARIEALDSDANYLYVGGNFEQMGGVLNTRIVARHDGTQWHSLDQGFWGDMGVTDIDVLGDDVYVAGDGGPREYFICGVARWDGTTWNGPGKGVSDCIYGDGVFAVEAFENGVVAGGTFNNAGNVSGTECLGSYKGDHWFAFGETLLDEDVNNIYAIAHQGNDMYVGGSFSSIADVTGTQYIAHWVSETVSSVTPKIEGAIKIYPNPTSDLIYIQKTDRDQPVESVRITDVTSQIVLEKKYPPSTIDVSFLPKGIYSAEIRTKTSRTIRFFIKE